MKRRREETCRRISALNSRTARRTIGICVAERQLTVPSTPVRNEHSSSLVCERINGLTNVAPAEVFGERRSKLSSCSISRSSATWRKKKIRKFKCACVCLSAHVCVFSHTQRRVYVCISTSIYCVCGFCYLSVVVYRKYDGKQ